MQLNNKYQKKPLLQTIFSFNKRVFNSVKESLGQPASLYAMLENSSYEPVILKEPANDISSGSVVKWHEWGRFNNGVMLGWRYDGGTYSSFSLKREEFANFGTRNITEDWECDIRSVTGLAASKSVLTDFDTLDSMVETNSPEMIDPINSDKLRENLAWNEIRILHRKYSSDFFATYLWDGRVFLINSGGSHHFAAARYIAARLGTPVLLHGKLCTYGINEASLLNLLRDFEIFVMANNPNTQIVFFTAMENFRASYLWLDMPRPYLDYRAIFLPKSETRSMKVATVLHDSGFCDLGLYLKNLILQQTHNDQSLCNNARNVQPCDPAGIYGPLHYSR